MSLLSNSKRAFFHDPNLLAMSHTTWAILGLLLITWIYLGGLRWLCRTFIKVLLILRHNQVPDAPPPIQPFQPPWRPPFPEQPLYEVYKDTRERLADEARRRGDRQWTLMTWVSGLFTAVIGGIIALVMDGTEIQKPLQVAITLWVIFVGGCAMVRILHDNVIKMYHVTACQEMDKYFGLHFDDSKHKIDMQQHHLFMEIILILGVGALFLTWNWEIFKEDSKPEPACACCCKAQPKPKSHAGNGRPEEKEVTKPNDSIPASGQEAPPSAPIIQSADKVSTPAPKSKASVHSGPDPKQTKR